MRRRGWWPVGGALGAAVAGFLLGTSRTETVAHARAQEKAARPGTVVPFEEACVRAAADVLPAVVHLSVRKTERLTREEFQRIHPQGPEPDEDILGRAIPSEGIGSGVLVSSDGRILTNHHVVRGAERVRVRLADRRVFEGKVLGSDLATDVAVVQIDATGLPHATLGDSDTLRVGQWVLAIGSPFGLSRTVTGGILSAEGRSRIGIVDYADFLQTDATIHPGNSGGPLVDLRGRVVGITTAIVSGREGAQGIGFAIPANMASRIAEQLLAFGEVRRGYLGVRIQDLTPPLATGLGLAEARGAIVSQVEEGSPASRAGLRRRDVVIRFDGAAIDGANDLRNRVAGTLPGTDSTVEILRDGAPRSIRVHLGRRPETGVEAGAGDEEGDPGDAPRRDREEGSAGEEPDLGLSLEEPARSGGHGHDGGLRIESVRKGSPAARAGLYEGEVVLEVGGEPVADRDTFDRLLRSRSSGSGVVLLVRGLGGTAYVVVEP